MTREDIVQAIDDEWEVNGKLDWLKFERVEVAILNLDAPDDEKVSLTKSWINAFTKRGHWDGY